MATKNPPFDNIGRVQAGETGPYATMTIREALKLRWFFIKATPEEVRYLATHESSWWDEPRPQFTITDTEPLAVEIDNDSTAAIRLLGELRGSDTVEACKAKP